MLELLAYPPIFRALVLILVSGFTMPVTGVFILRMNLLPIRYLMMHGVLLGGALGLAFDLNVSACALGVNLLLILLLNRSSSLLGGGGYGHLSLFFMSATVAAASVVMALWNVPARDTLSLLWGSLYTGSRGSILGTAVLGLILWGFSLFFFRRLTALFHSREVARAMGMNPGFMELFIMVLTAFTVALAMKIMGALLLDVIILLPAVMAAYMARGFKGMLVLSCLLGGLFSLGGFFLALIFDIPVSAGAAGSSLIVFLILILFQKGVFNGKTS